MKENMTHEKVAKTVREKRSRDVIYGKNIGKTVILFHLFFFLKGFPWGLKGLPLGPEGPGLVIDVA